MVAAHPIRPAPDDPALPAGGTGGPSEPLARLLSLSARGDEAAFETLYDATSSRIFGLVLRLVRNQAIAEEVSQEVYLQVWRTASRYDESKGSAVSWLMTLAHRRAVDRIRATEADSRRDTAYHQDDILGLNYDSTAATAEASMDAARVRAALRSLSTVQQEVLELAYFRGHTHAEIAQMTGVPIGTAKTRIRDGLIRLRSLVGEAA